MYFICTLCCKNFQIKIIHTFSSWEEFSHDCNIGQFWLIRCLHDLTSAEPLAVNRSTCLSTEKIITQIARLSPYRSRIFHHNYTVRLATIDTVESKRPILFIGWFSLRHVNTHSHLTLTRVLTDDASFVCSAEEKDDADVTRL